jgi:hypothetical protein
MNKQRTKPNGWIYGLVALIPVFGCLIAMAVANHRLPSLSETLDSIINIDNMTQVLVPGSEDITFAEKGAYAVYYEYRSVVDGVVYASSETPPALVCSLTSKASGEDIGTAPDYVKTNTYSTKDRERVGVLIQSITVKEPGVYTFSCSYADHSSQPEIVLAVGHNFMWEFFGIVAKYGLPLIEGLATLLGSGLVAIVIIIVIAIIRHKSKQQVGEVVNERN